MRGKTGLAVEEILIPFEQAHPNFLLQTPNGTSVSDVLLGVNYAHFEVH
jgi:hypothetical protein